MKFTVRNNNCLSFRLGRLYQFFRILIEQYSEKKYWYISFPIIFCIIYFLIQGISFSQFKSGGDIDTSEMLIYIQYWDWGYGGSQPPLYAWIVLLVTNLFGLSLLSLSLVKFTMLGIAFVSIYAAARKIKLTPLASASAMLGVFAIPGIAWEMQRSLSHSAALLAFCSLGILAFLHAGQTYSVRAYIAFGLSVACAILSKYNAIVFFVSLIFAGLLLPPWRRAILNWKFSAALLGAGLLIAPHAIWAYHHPGAVFARASKFEFSATGSVLTNFFWGTHSFLKSNLSMLAIVMLTLAATMARQHIMLQNLRLPRRSDPASLFAYIILIGLTIMWLGLLISGATAFHNRWLQPILLLFPLVLAIAASNSVDVNTGVSLKIQEKVKTVNLNQAILGLVCAFIAMFALPLATLFTKTDLPTANRLNYQALHAAIQDSLGKAPATILSTNYSHFANLRLYQPSLNFIHPFHPEPVRLNQEPLVILWEGNKEMPKGTRVLSHRAGVGLDQLTTVNGRLVRIDNPDIGMDISFAHDSAHTRVKTQYESFLGR